MLQVAPPATTPPRSARRAGAARDEELEGEIRRVHDDNYGSTGPARCGAS